MAALGANQVARVYESGEADRVALYAVRNTTTADTIDLSVDFTRIKQVVFMGATVNGIANGTISAGTTVTVPAGLTNDAAWMLVWGCAQG